MILLDATNRKLQIVLAGAKTSLDCPFVSSYVDIAQTGFAMQAASTTTGNSNGTTAVDIVAAPASGNTRQLKWFSLYNGDTGAITPTIRFNDNSTNYKLITVTLQVGEMLQFDAEDGWTVYDTLGNIKTLVSTALKGPVVQVFTSGSGTYTPTTGTVWSKVRAWGAGGGGGGSGTSPGAATNGGDTIFNSIRAGGGKLGINGTIGAGGTSATGTATFRFSGNPGYAAGVVYGTTTSLVGIGGNGGGSGLGGGGGPGGVGAANGVADTTGGGGGGGGLGNTVIATFVTYSLGFSGGGGEGIEIVVTSPAAVSYTVGAAGSGGTAGTNGQAGGNGGSGLLIVEDYFGP